MNMMDNMNNMDNTKTDAMNNMDAMKMDNMEKKEKMDSMNMTDNMKTDTMHNMDAMKTDTMNNMDTMNKMDTMDTMMMEPSLPSVPFIVFLTPSSPIANVGGLVPSAIPAPQTLFSISRAAVQIAVAKYAAGLAARGVGVVGLEDAVGPFEDNVDAAVKSILKVLPGLTIKDNGKLVKA
ncbi:hypothetical protein M422DRAFT_56654 [Sphaerobolus stellatus SS14]|uniref:Uncharacterized protein n=1 Tax=Sphaerobolus stellatus (strain SS14) TaxID=990650 RepID=A0A0C9T4W1_SPHS4|nr:hypothetical protein M422DRAFT_56654 [Sphaerobolus stellatus SS14]